MTDRSNIDPDWYFQYCTYCGDARAFHIDGNGPCTILRIVTDTRCGCPQYEAAE